MDGAYTGIGQLLEQASDVIRRQKTTTGSLGSAKGCKRVQVESLKQFADQEKLWCDDFLLSELAYLSSGGENEVYTSDVDVVVKLNNFEYAGDDMENFFIRMRAHNLFFSNVPYALMGFAYNSKLEFCAVIVQSFIRAVREATVEEISHYMRAIGFTEDAYDEFHNERYEVFDAVPHNVLYGIDNELYFIDTQIRLR